MKLWDKLSNKGLGNSGGLKGLGEEISDRLSVGKKSSPISSKPIRIKGKNPYGTGIYFTKEDTQRLTRKIENLVDKVNPEAAEKLKKVNEKKENLGQTVENFLDANSPFNIVVRAVTEAKELSRGDHLVVQRIGYTHHGLFVGNQEVIHYRREEGIVKTSLNAFAANAKIHIKDSPKYYTNSQIVSRAYDRLGESGYNLFHNNCENFVSWCRSGR